MFRIPNRLKTATEWFLYWARVLYVGTRLCVHLLLSVACLLVLWADLVVVSKSLIDHGPARLKDGSTEAGLFLTFAFASQACSPQEYLRKLKAVTRPSACRGPAWLRNGLFNGRWADIIPWTRTEADADRLAQAICMGSWTLLAVSQVPTWFGRAPNPLPTDVLAVDLILTNYVAMALVVLKMWHHVHLRLRPFQDPRGFDLIMPAPVTEEGEVPTSVLADRSGPTC